MLIRNPLLLPSLKAAGNVVIGKSTLPCFVLDWSGFPAEAGPDGCVDARFALSKDIASKLRELSLATELSSPDDLGRWAAGCCMIATAGCVSALSKLLADSAVVVGVDGSAAWMPKERKESLSKWISTRIWRLSSLTKRTGHDPESLSLIGLPDKEERVPMITAPAVSNVVILSETLEKEESSPPYDYRAVAAMAGKLYRVHLCLDGAGPRDFFRVRRTREDGSEEIGNVSMDRDKDGNIIVLVMGDIYPPGSRDKLYGINEKMDDLEDFDVEYRQTSAFLSDWVLNGEEQSPGMVEEVGNVPGLKGEARSFKYSSGYIRTGGDKEDDEEDGLFRSVAVHPPLAGLANLNNIIEEGDVFVDRGDGHWFCVVSIHEGNDGGPVFHLNSALPENHGCSNGGFYPYEDEELEAGADLDELLSGYVPMCEVDLFSKSCKLEVTRTVKGDVCIGVLLVKGSKAMKFELGNVLPNHGSSIVAILDDRMVFEDKSAELFEDVINRLGYWEHVGAPKLVPADPIQPLVDIINSIPAGGGDALSGVKVGSLAKEFGVSPRIVIELARAYNIEAKNASTVLKPGQADRLRAKLESARKGK